MTDWGLDGEITFWLQVGEVGLTLVSSLLSFLVFVNIYWAFIQLKSFGLASSRKLNSNCLEVIMQFNMSSMILVLLLLCFGYPCVCFLLRLVPLGHSMASQIQQGEEDS